MDKLLEPQTRHWWVFGRDGRETKGLHGYEATAAYLIKGTSFLEGIEANCWQFRAAAAYMVQEPLDLGLSCHRLLRRISTRPCSPNVPSDTLEGLKIKIMGGKQMRKLRDLWQ